MGAIIAYLSISAFLFQQYFGPSEIHYAIVFGIGEAFIAVGLFANGMAIIATVILFGIKDKIQN
ncbi:MULTISPECIES: hypothetical protein [Cysteiniphilum]|uniref:hypothetical protein n=1 Tax=Cysteiniphilum TaxID=2056696 RepID=UPI001781EF06|nr:MULTISPECIES: hypothetical protein [Cysteiniphilum]